MLKNHFQLLKQSCNQLKHVVSVRTQAQNNTNQKWDLFSAVCLERKPVVTPALTEIEKEYKQYLKDLEFELSVKSNFELRHEADVKHLAVLKEGGEIDDTEVNLKQTAQDLKDLWNAEAAEFKPADKITDADKKNDLKSLNRKLDKHLIFVVNQKLGDKKLYMLPQGLRQDGETLRQVAERVLKETIGSELKTQIYSNAPCGFYKYKYPANIQQERNVVGAKIFIYFARYLKGQPSLKGIDYKWLDRTELDKTLPPQYKSSVQQFLIDE